MLNKVMLSTESRMRGDMQVRFGGRYGKTYRRKAARRPVPSLRLGRGGDIFTLAGELAGSSDFLTQAKYISDVVGGNLVPRPAPRPAKERVSEPAFQAVEQRTLDYSVLRGYLSERGIPSE